MNKQIEETIKALEDLANASPTAEIEITSEDKNALISAISILKLFLSVKGAPKKKEQIAKTFDGTHLCSFNEGYNLCHDEFTACLAGRVVENQSKGRAILEAIQRTEVGDNVIIHNTDKSVWCILKKICKEHEEE